MTKFPLLAAIALAAGVLAAAPAQADSAHTFSGRSGQEHAFGQRGRVPNAATRRKNVKRRSASRSRASKRRTHSANR